MITVAVLKIDNTLEVRTISGDLKSMQDIVGGLIEAVHLSDGLDMMCNEEGRLIGLPLNFRLGQMPIMGDVFFTRHNDEGEPVSLSVEDIGYLSELTKQLRVGMRRAMG